jgi:ParB-like chromosome segregation protein Spo0J
MNAHPAADIFPLLDGDNLQELADDIAANGQREPIIMWDGRILDGRNRWRACGIAGIDPVAVSREFQDESSAIRFVISANLHRRHLTPSAKAMAAARVMGLFEDAARERHREGSSKGGKAVAKLPGPSEERRARDDAAETFGTSPRSVQEYLGQGMGAHVVPVVFPCALPASPATRSTVQVP